MGRARGHNRTNTWNIAPWCQNTSGNCCSWPRCCCTSSAGAAADALNLKPSPAEDFRLAASKSAQASHLKNLHFHTLLPAFICLLYLPPVTFQRCPMVGVLLHGCIWVGAHSFSHIKLWVAKKHRDELRAAPSVLQIYSWTLRCLVM